MGLQLIRPDTKIDFMSKRRIFLCISALLLLIGLISLFLRGGLRYGIDFVGGVNIQVKFAQKIELGKLKNSLQKFGLPEMRLQRFGMEQYNEYLMRFSAPKISPEKLRNQVSQALEQTVGNDFEIQRLEMVGPKVGEDLKNKALQALFYAVLLISIYISGRFEQKWGTALLMAAGLVSGLYILQLFSVPWTYLIGAAIAITLGVSWYLKLNFALGAVVALIHDVLIMVAVFSILNKDFDLTTVAALLTIIGYSLNDTIVIFDRIRENLKFKANRPLYQTINESINQTLSRTLITSATTLMVVLPLFILGGGVIHDFALALLIGIISGTYSSIFIASSLLLGIGPTPVKEKEVEEPARA